MTSLYLIRHAQAEGNVLNRFQGRTDLPLTKTGRQQVYQVAARMRAIPLSAVYTSPLRRAFETAEGIAARHGMRPIPCDFLVELDGGEMENRPYDELKERFPDAFRYFVEEPHKFGGVGGESMREVYDRMRDGILGLVKKHPGDTIAAVSHGAALRCFYCYGYGLPLERMSEVGFGGNTGVSHITFDDELKPMIHYISDTSHMDVEILPAGSGEGRG